MHQIGTHLLIGIQKHPIPNRGLYLFKNLNKKLTLAKAARSRRPFAVVEAT